MNLLAKRLMLCIILLFLPFRWVLLIWLIIIEGGLSVFIFLFNFVYLWIIYRGLLGLKLHSKCGKMSLQAQKFSKFLPTPI